MEPLLGRLIAVYSEVRRISEWKVFQNLETLDQINEILNRRTVLIEEADGLLGETQLSLESLPPSLHGKYRVLSGLIQDITRQDTLLMNRIEERKREILEELRQRVVLRREALPSYRKQMYALAQAY
ncbi:MAG: hypothetical protein A2293_11855 [Elusimicrobia bacterium RIFOXYB2_FULL_49_7]|nr:MAG: hypothetical protein A2293_11855 [Elusimicrobia bacterium RIFOXYB2_FULL_49_7]